MIIEHKQDFWTVLGQHVKPERAELNQVELKNVIKGTKLNERFRSSETVEKAELEEKNLTFYTMMKIIVFLWKIKILNKFLFQQIS